MVAWRFAIRQGDKVRCIDDLRENELNNAYTAVEKITLSAMDHMIWALQTLLRYFTQRGEVSLELSTGEVLKGKVHEAWSLDKGSLVVTALDLRSAYKQLPLNPLDQVLGVKLDLSLAHEGEIRITNKPSRIEEVRGLLESAVALKALVPSKVPRSLGGSGRHAVSLDGSQLAALEVLKARFELGRPLSIKASVPVPPAVIFTDGALEDGKATIGGVLYPSCRQMPAEVFGATLPCNVLELLKGDKEHVIGAVELFAVAVAIKLW
ncbi:unnamed protein product, partial [Symbiodinium sp. CCMP2456]